MLEGVEATEGLILALAVGEGVGAAKDLLGAEGVAEQDSCSVGSEGNQHPVLDGVAASAVASDQRSAWRLEIAVAADAYPEKAADVGAVEATLRSLAVRHSWRACPIA